MLEILPLILGPVATNAYLIADSDTSYRSCLGWTTYRS